MWDMVGKLTATPTTRTAGVDPAVSGAPAPADTAPHTQVERPTDATGLAISGTKSFGPQHGGAATGRTAGIRLTANNFTNPKFARLFDRPAVSTINETTESMSIARGAAYDAVDAGRPVDAELVEELARHTWTTPSGIRPPLDSVDRQVDVGELVARNIINGPAFEQITNNGNMKGFEQPLVERVAFALAAQDAGGVYVSKFITAVRGADPKKLDIMDALHDNIGSNEDKSLWKTVNRDRATRLLKDIGAGKLMQSTAVTDILRERMDRANDEMPLSDKFGVPGHLAFRAGRRAGLSIEGAQDIAMSVASLTLDLSTLQLLTPRVRDRVVVGSYSMQQDLLPFAEAKTIARDVANGDYSFGQVEDIVSRFVATKASIPPVALSHVPSLLRALNNGEVTVKGLTNALDAHSYWANIQSESFSQLLERPHRTGLFTSTPAQNPRYEDYGAAITQHLSPEMIVAFAQEPDCKADFVKTFEALVSGGLRAARKSDEPRFDAFKKLVEASFNKAKAQHGF